MFSNFSCKYNCRLLGQKWVTSLELRSHVYKLEKYIKSQGKNVLVIDDEPVHKIFKSDKVKILDEANGNYGKTRS